MVDVYTTISIIIFNINGLNATIKIQNLSEWLKKQAPTICCLQGIHFKYKNIHRLQVNGWRNIYLANVNHKNAWVAALISDKGDFKARKVIRDKELHYIMKKGWWILQET